MSIVPERMREFRDLVASRYVGGLGIEIGPGNAPVRLPEVTARALYVDIAPIEDLIGVHAVPEGWTAPDIVDDADRLTQVDDESIDFVIACHVIEHTQDPLRVLRTWMRKIRPTGVLFMAVPDRRFGFDINRPLTPTDHVVEDFLNGAHHSEDDHLYEWATVVNGITGEAQIAEHMSEMKRLDLRPHYHVWELQTFLDLLLECRGTYLDFELEFCGRNDTETLIVLRKPAKN